MIKGLCTISTGSVVNLLVEGELPEVGHYYILESATEGTEAQRKTREKLIKLYWKSGDHPKYGGDGLSMFRDKLKRDLGEGIEKYIYGYIYNGKPKIKEVKNKSDIPEDILNDPERSENIMAKIKSFTKYTKKQQIRFIDNLILDMTANGVCSKEFDNLLDGIKDG